MLYMFKIIVLLIIKYNFFQNTKNIDEKKDKHD